MPTIEELINKFASAGLSGLALDIDSTSADTAYILVEKGFEEFGNPYNMSARDVIEQYRYLQDIPFWPHDKIEEFINYWCYNSDFQKDIPLIERASEFIWKIDAIIKILLHLSARPPIVYPGTYYWMQNKDIPKVDLRFSTPEEGHLNNRNEYKARELLELYPYILGIIDDHPELLSYFPYDYEGTIFVFDYKEKHTHPRAICCSDWEHTFYEVKKRFAV